MNASLARRNLGSCCVRSGRLIGDAPSPLNGGLIEKLPEFGLGGGGEHEVTRLYDQTLLRMHIRLSGPVLSD